MTPEKASDEVTQVKFGTFSGVFTPTVLTILGAIMYLREGWVVGNAGLVGAILIILLAHLITIPTGLAVASIATNIRVGAGGAYAIITQSLGLEAGGSIGVPLYLARTVSAVLYLLAFAEGWQAIYPTHPLWLVAVITFVVVFGISYVSTSFATKTQVIILAVIVVSLISVALGSMETSTQKGLVHEPELWGTFEEGSFWVTFAIFFPAVTGIVAGISLSDVLEDPRKNIPLGMLAGVFLTLVIYLVLAFWLAKIASPEELRSNMTIMVDRSYWRWAVLLGLLGATFSSALGSLVAAPRVMQALGSHGLLPLSGWFAAKTKAGEPRHAMQVTGLLTGVTLVIAILGGGLNFVAPMITMFFLLTYAILNLVVVIEQRLDMVSFRPTLAIPRWVPMVGLASCLFVMFLVNPIFSLVSIAMVVAIYWYLAQRALPGIEEGDVRSGLFLSLAGWAVEMVGHIPAAPERTWSPNILVPVASTSELRGSYRLLRALSRKGALHSLGIYKPNHRKDVAELEYLCRDLNRDGISTRSSILESTDFARGTMAAMELLKATFFRPNILFLRLSVNGKRKAKQDGEDQVDQLQVLARQATEHKMGVVLLLPDPVAELGREHQINVWIRDQGPEWSLSLRLGNDLSLLLAYELARAWEGSILFCMAVQDEETKLKAETYLNTLISLARLKKWAQARVVVASFQEALDEVPQADLSILGLPEEIPSRDRIEWMSDLVKGSVILVRDSGNESVLA